MDISIQAVMSLHTFWIMLVVHPFILTEVLPEFVLVVSAHRTAVTVASAGGFWHYIWGVLSAGLDICCVLPAGASWL